VFLEQEIEPEQVSIVGHEAAEDAVMDEPEGADHHEAQQVASRYLGHEEGKAASSSLATRFSGRSSAQ
jgi:hypothetical protein